MAARLWRRLQVQQRSVEGAARHPSAARRLGGASAGLGFKWVGCQPIFSEAQAACRDCSGALLTVLHIPHALGSRLSGSPGELSKQPALDQCVQSKEWVGVQGRGPAHEVWRDTALSDAGQGLAQAVHVAPLGVFSAEGCESRVASLRVHVGVDSSAGWSQGGVSSWRALRRLGTCGHAGHCCGMEAGLTRQAAAMAIDYRQRGWAMRCHRCWPKSEAPLLVLLAGGRPTTRPLLFLACTSSSLKTFSRYRCRWFAAGRTASQKAHIANSLHALFGWALW